MTDHESTDPLADFPAVVAIVVQWGDQDAFGHVNNTVFLRWFEVGRIAYLQHVGMEHGLDGRTVGPILAAVSCSFRRQVTFPDRVRVGTRVTRVGTSSMLMEHVAVGDRLGAVVADGTSTVVHFDYRAGASCPITDDLRRAIADAESAPRRP